MVELDKTDQLIQDIADYSYYILKKNNLENKKLTEKEWEKLQEFYERSLVVRDELQNMESSVLNRDLSFVEVETTVLRNGRKLKDNTIVDGFQTIEQKFELFLICNLMKVFIRLSRNQGQSGQRLQKKKAVAIARKFMNDHDGPIATSEMSFSADGKIPVHGVRTVKEGDEIATYLEVTKKGGHVIQMYMERPIDEVNLDFQAAEEKAREFLKAHDFIDMELVDVSTDTNTAIFIFVPTEKGIRLYSDMVKTHVALDNGQVIAFDQTSYLSYHHQRTVSTPKLKKKRSLKL